MGDFKQQASEYVPGFKTVWKAGDAGPQQEVTCPRCGVVFGSVGEVEQKELLCKGCQTIYGVKGNRGGQASAEPLRRTIVVEGMSDSRLGDALRGKRPECFGLTTGDIVVNAIIIVLLFIAIAIAIQ